MTASFTLHPQLAADTFPVGNLSLSQILLMNNADYPWLVLVPAGGDLREITDLPPHERYRLMDEVAQASEALQRLTQAHKMNIAALGNLVPQLHVHIIARFPQDAAWPAPVWGKGGRPYKPEAAEEMVQKLRAALNCK